MNLVLAQGARVFDNLESRWQGIKAQRLLGTALVLLFLGTILAIELNRQGLLPDPPAPTIPTNHFAAVYLAFTLLLLVEVLGLVFALSQSVANSVGKQFEVLSLILLRKAFLEFGSFSEPIDWGDASDSLLHMLSDAGGALLVFVAVGFFYRVQRHQPITTDKMEQTSFVATKKLVALVLLFAFGALGAYYLRQRFMGEPVFGFFEAFYVLLIFSDILIVLVSLRYSYSYSVVFRNSGFAVSTMMIRLALTAPPYINALLGIGSAVFSLGLSLAYNAFAPVMQHQEGENGSVTPLDPDDGQQRNCIE